MENVNKVATHILVFLIRSITNQLSCIFATFSASGITAFQLFPILRTAVSILEVTCQLKVIAPVTNGALLNRKFFRMLSVRMFLFKSHLIFYFWKIHDDFCLWYFVWLYFRGSYLRSAHHFIQKRIVLILNIGYETLFNYQKQLI